MKTPEDNTGTAGAAGTTTTTTAASATTGTTTPANGKPAAKPKKGKTIAEMRAAKGGGKGLTAAEKKAANAALAKGAAEIRAAKAGKGGKGAKGKKEKPPQEPAPVVTLSPRNPDELAAEYLAPGSNGKAIEVTKDLPAEEWATLIRGVDRKREYAGFVIGDLLAYGEKKYTGALYDAALKATGCALKTLQNYKNVATKVAPAIRHLDSGKVTFGHHQAVQALPAGEQKRLLNKAEKEELPLSKFRKEVRAILPKKEPKKKKPAPPAPKSGDPLTAAESKAFDAFQDRLDDIVKFLNGTTWKKLTKADRKSLVPNFQRIAEAHQAVVAE